MVSAIYLLIVIRRSIDGPLRFDSLKSAGVFVLAAVVVAPFLSSFLDAGFVTLIGWQEESYWNVWRARLPSNALAAIHELHRIRGRYALVTMCIGGAQGIAAIFERM